MRAGTLLAALFFILAGLVIFLANLGYVSPDFVRHLVRFWPLILIVIGISLFWGGTIPRFLAFFLVVIAVAGVLVSSLLITGPVPTPRDGVHTDLRVERDRHPGLETGRLNLHFGGGQLFLDGRTENWFEGSFRGPTGTTPSYSVRGDELVLNMRENRVSWPTRNIINIWHLHLSPDLDWDLSVESGAVDGELNLEGIPLQNVKIKVGAGNMEVRLGENGQDVSMRVEAGATNMKILVREDTALDMGVKGVLANTNLKELGWPQVDGRYRSPVYNGAVSTVTLDVEVAVGNFTVEVLPVQR